MANHVQSFLEETSLATTQGRYSAPVGAGEYRSPRSLYEIYVRVGFRTTGAFGSSRKPGGFRKFHIVSEIVELFETMLNGVGKLQLNRRGAAFLSSAFLIGTRQPGLYRDFWLRGKSLLHQCKAGSTNDPCIIIQHDLHRHIAQYSFHSSFREECFHKDGLRHLGNDLRRNAAADEDATPRHEDQSAVSGGRPIYAHEQRQGLITDFGFALESDAGNHCRGIGSRADFVPGRNRLRTPSLLSRLRSLLHRLPCLE